MKVTFWGTRGSLPNAGPETVRYGGNTSCVEVRGHDGTLIVLDAGTGIRRFGAQLTGGTRRIDILLTHLHMDHIQGLGFFQPLYESGCEIHIWGPRSTTLDLRSRLARYLSPPLFPVRVRDLPSNPQLHDLTTETVQIGGLSVSARMICHPGPTLGYRITENGASIAYMPDHEPALCGGDGETLMRDRDWLSGSSLAAGVDLLIHDAQYAPEEYGEHVGWGHSTMHHALEFASLCGARRLATFHHDPAHDDSALDRMVAEARDHCEPSCEVIAGTEGAVFEIA
jgi:phosphoribosyl 1,2-cyclic phosphodiesterase